MVALRKELDGLGRRGRAFLGWWIGELGGLLPHAVRLPTRRRFGAALRGEMIEISELGRQGWRPLGSASIDRPAELVGLLPRSGRHAPELTLRLDADHTLRRRLVLPLAAAEDLRSAVAFQLDRYTPFSPAEVFFGVAPVRRDETAQTVVVDLAVAPRSQVEAAKGRLATLGVETASVRLDGGEGAPDIEFAMEPDGFGRLPGERARSRLALPALAAALAVGVVLVPWLRGQAALAEARQALQQARGDALATAELQKTVERLRHRLLFARQRRDSAPSMEHVLAELTRIVPDGTWAVTLNVEGGKIQFTGYSHSANGLIATLEQSEMFAHAAFRSPVTQDPGTRLEQFNLYAELRPVSGAEGGDAR